MNAKEAKRTATSRAAELEKQREEAEHKKNVALAEKWRKERADWETNRLTWIERDIEEAVGKGKTEISVHLVTRDKPEDATEEVYWKSTAFAPELKRVIAHFKKLGYKLKFRVERYENVDLSDLSPRDNWFTYMTMLDVSW